MPNIEILVRNRIARANYGERIISNNTDYTITFDFDEEWEATDKVARFEIEDGYVDVPFSGNSVCAPCLPATARQVNIGVYAGELHTTSAATVTVIPSVLGGSKIEYVPITDAGLADAKDLEDADTVRVYDVSQGKLYKATLEQLRVQMGSSGGSNDHSKLENRDAADQHPISAITGLENALANKQPSGEYLTQEDLQAATDIALAQAKASGEFDGKSAYSYAVDGGYTGTEAEFAAKLAEETGTVPENVALLEDVTVDEASGDFIPMLSQNGTEYRLSIGDDGVPVIKNANGATVWSGTSGGSSGGGDDPGSDTPTGEWVSGAEVAYTLVDGEWAKEDGSFAPFDGWSRTDFIYCYGAGHIYHSCSGSVSINIVFYDIAKNFVSSHDGYDAWAAIPENAAYVVMSYTTEGMTGSVIKLYKKVEPTWTNGEPYEFTFIENEYINTGNGQPTAYNGWKRTDYVNCAGATKITKTNASAYSQYGAFYNAEKERIAKMITPNTTGGTSADITVPVGACYFITSDSNANMDALVLIPYA